MGFIIKLFKGSTITDADRATSLLKSPLAQKSLWMDDMQPDERKKMTLRVAGQIYQSLLLRIPGIVKDDVRHLEELLQVIEYNEDEIVMFLKYRTWPYQRLLNQETSTYINEADAVLKLIKFPK